ncbi:dienelactone hydrolase family protein [Sandaracinus amylolyticus]|uniref:dienelactone hydrolase family protein n=1 Tax=Sandaracinus amylolyticus TaxID=927083 RepID=UPI001F3726F5|nr:dienelactone hydrolase family protein [Sandaracinus amylolyticus]UJR78450.1 Carboxymethylenebutenolidase [Sandaracinus amylolyticus]
MIEKLEHTHGGVTFEAHLAFPPSEGPHGAILIAPTWRGQTDFERAKAERIASELGLVGVAIDVYGKGVTGTSAMECVKLSTPLKRDRGLLRARMLAAFDAVRAHPRVDAARLGAIGFCFGGQCVLDLARAGAELRAVITFHGVLDPPEGLEVGPIRAKILALHGHDDPLATPEQLLAFETEMTKLGADWEVHTYGGTTHAFTNPAANDPGRTMYSERADRRSWIAMRAFLEEVDLITR